MSLRLLQKNAAAGEARGRGRGRQQRTMSLQQFQHESTPVPARTGTTGSVWGRGSGAADSTPASASAAPTLQEARGRGRRGLIAPEPRQSAWQRGAPQSAVDALWDAPAAAPAVSDDTSWDLLPQITEDATPNWDVSSPLTSGADSGAGLGTQPEDEDISLDVIAWLTELKLDMHREAVLAWCLEMGAASLDEVVDSIDELISSVEFTSLQTKRIQKNAVEALETVKAKSGSASAQLVIPLTTSVTSVAEHLGVDDRCPEGGSFYKGKGGSMRGRGVRATTESMAGATPSASSSCSGRGRARGRGGGVVDESSSQSFYDGGACPKDDCRSEEYGDDADREECGNADGSRSFYKDGGGSFCTDRAPDGLQDDEEALFKSEGFHTRGIVKALAERELVTIYRKEHTTEKATWEPAKKVSQGSRKKNLMKTTPDSKQACPEPTGVGDGREAARQLFEQQLKASEDFAQALKQRDGRQIRQLHAEGLLGKPELEVGQALLIELASENLASAIKSRNEVTVEALLAQDHLKTPDVAAAKSFLADEASRRCRQKQVRATISRLRSSDNCDELRRSISEAHGILDVNELQEAEDDLQRMLERRHRRCIDAVAMLHDAIRAPRDAAFGAVARQAFQDETCARLLDGGVEAIDDLQAALDEWEKKQLAHKEARMVLALAKRRNNPEALQIAINEAREAGLPPEDELMCEALEELDKIHQEHRAVKEVADRLQHALQANNPLELEQAIEDCARWRLPLGDARERLAQLRDEATRRFAAVGSLRAATEAAESPEAMRAALKEARQAGVEDSVMKEAEAQISALEVASKRRENASVELFLARQARSSQRLEAAIIDSQRLGADTTEMLEAASEELLEVRKEEQRRDQVILSAPSKKESLRDEHEVEEACGQADLREAERTASARRDASILEFSYAGLQKREFFKAPVAMNDFFTEKYSMREGSDFKLKVVTSCSSVLIAFRSPEVAEAILRTAKPLAQTLPSGNQASVIASAEVRGPLDFGTEVEGSLPECRQDADKLQREVERPQAMKAIQSVTQLILGDSSGAASMTALPTAGEEDAEGFVTIGKGGRSLPMPRVTRAETTGFSSGSCYPGKGKADFRRAQTTAFSSGPSHYAGKGKASHRSGNLACNPPQTVPLPKEAAMALRHDWAKAELFHKDLELFANKNNIAATCDEHTEVVLRSTGSLQSEEWESVRAELQGLISHHFPQERRRSRLRVSDDRGAGIELNWVEDGYQVDAIEEYPGQEFLPGEIIVEINGVSLVGLTEEKMEDTFSEHFVNGASLALIRYSG